MNKTLTKLLALLGVFLFLGGGSVWGAAPDCLYLRGDAINNFGAGLKMEHSTNKDGDVYSVTVPRLWGHFAISEDITDWDKGIKFGSDDSRSFSLKNKDGEGDNTRLAWRGGSQNWYLDGATTESNAWDNVTVTLYYREDRGNTNPNYISVVVGTSYAIHGQIFGDPNWSATPMTEKNGKWVIENVELKTGNFGIRKYEGTYSNSSHQKGWITSDNRNNIQNINVGTWMNCSSSGQNFNLSEAGSYNITFDPTGNSNQGTILFEKAGPQYDVLYLRGEMNGWATTDDWKFNTTDGKNYTLEGVTIEAGKDFKVGTADWSKSYTLKTNWANNATKSISINTDYTLAHKTGEGYNMELSATAAKATVTFNSETGAFKVYVPDVRDIETIYLIGSGSIKDGGTLSGTGYTNNPIQKIKGENGADDYYQFTVSNLDWFRFSTNRATSADQFSEGSYAPVTSNEQKEPVERPFNAGVTGEFGRTLAIVPNAFKVTPPWNGTYLVTIDERFTTINMKALDDASKNKVREVYLHLVDKDGNPLGGAETTDNKILMGSYTDGDYNRFITSVELDPTKEYYYYFEDNGTKKSAATSVKALNNQDKPEKVSSTANSKLTTTALSGKSKVLVHYWNSYDFDTEKGVSVAKFEVHNKSPYTSEDYPEAVYMYGQLNGYGWRFDNHYTLTPVSGKTGVYSADYVDISGSWDTGDIKEVPARIQYNSSGDENYVTFFLSPRDDEHDFSEPKLSTISDGGNMSVYKGYQKEAVKYEANDLSNNFMVAEGFYYVEVDLVNQTVSFKRYEPGTTKDVNMHWFVGGTLESSDNAEIAPNQDVHAFRSSSNNAPHILQIGVDANPTHRVARQVVYVVNKYTPYSSADNLKRKADNVESLTENQDGGNPVTFHGDGGYNSNNLIQFDAPGIYEVKAFVSDDASGISGYNIINNPDNQGVKMTVYVDVDAEFSQNDDTKVPFDPSGTTTFSNLFSFTQDVTYNTDFTLSIKATDNAATEWKSGTYNEDDFFPALARQYNEIVKSNNNIVDGYYNASSVKMGEVTKNDDGSFDVAVNVPCSGTYTISLEPAGSNPFNIQSQTISVSVYPNLQCNFGEDTGFNINGFTYSRGTNTNYNIVYDKSIYPNVPLSEVPAYCPGTYFAKTFIEGNSAKSAPRKANNYTDVTYPYAYVAMLNLEDLNNFNEEHPMHVEVTITKNGATGDYIFAVYPGENSDNVSTGVEAIGGEEGEAEYFNLQGVKVQNPEHGIYVKVVNGKATKVIL